MKDALTLAPSAGRSPVHISFTFPSISTLSAREQVDRTAWRSRLVLPSLWHYEGREDSRREARNGSGCVQPPRKLCPHPTRRESCTLVPVERAPHIRGVFTPASLSLSDPVQQFRPCCEILLRKVINYSLRIPALVQSWARSTERSNSRGYRSTLFIWIICHVWSVYFAANKESPSLYLSAQMTLVALINNCIGRVYYVELSNKGFIKCINILRTPIRSQQC